MSERNGVVAVALLTEREMAGIGRDLSHAYRLDAADDFRELLAAIDLAERSIRTGQDGIDVKQARPTSRRL